MEIKINKPEAIKSAILMIVGAIAGSISMKLVDNANTPEDVLARLESAKVEYNSSKASLKEQEKETNKALDSLRRTKKAYQDEIRPTLEEKIRKDLETYISKADETYAKAKRENEMADLKLELAKEYSSKGIQLPSSLYYR